MILPTLAYALSVIQPMQMPCEPLPGWSAAVEAADGGALIFGEGHGTQESPAVFAEVVCAAAASGGSVLVALELANSQQAALQDAWRASPEDFERELYQALPIWRSSRDGRASVAMLAMLTRLHALKSQGMQIDISAFNASPAQATAFNDLPGQEPHEAAQALNIATARNRGDYSLTLVLVGNLHARKTPVSSRGGVWKPMGVKLEERGVSVVTLESDGPAGASWNCRLRPDFDISSNAAITEKDVVCGPSPEAAGKYQGDPRIELGGSENYDGFFRTGSTTASPPAFSDKKESVPQ